MASITYLLIRRVQLVILMFILLQILVGCTRDKKTDLNTDVPIEQPPIASTVQKTEDNEGNTYVYTEVNDVSFFEHFGYRRFNGTNGYLTKTENTTYYFPKDITQEECSHLVATTESLFQEIHNRIGIVLNDKYEIHICRTDYIPLVEDNKLFVGYSSTKSEEYAVGIAKLCLGNEVNYGMIYGLGYDLAKQVGVQTSRVSDFSTALALYDSEPYYFDLNYACFLEVYADESTIAKLKRISIEFYYYLTNYNLLGLYCKYSSEIYRDYLNQFLLLNGKEAYDNTDLDGFSFYGGGEAVRLVWENDKVKYYLMDDYKVTPNYQLFPEDMLNSGYKNLRKVIIAFKQQIDFAANKFSKYITVNQKIVKFTLTSHISKNKGGQAFIDKKDSSIIAEIYTPWAVVHEYIHELLDEKLKSGWQNEMLAYYYGQSFEMSYDINYYVQFYNKVMEERGMKDTNLYPKVIDKLGHTVDLSSETDYKFFWNAYVVYNGNERLVFSNAGADAKIMFFNYLMEKYEEDLIQSALLNDNPEEVLGCDWKTLFQQWVDWLHNNYYWAENNNE